MIRLLIADDEIQACQDMLACVQWANQGISVEAVCEDGEQALARIRALHPDIALLDIEMPGLSGLAVIEQAQIDFPDMAFIIVSGYDSFQYMQKAISLRVDGYLLKPYSRDDLLREIARATERLEMLHGLSTPQTQSGFTGYITRMEQIGSQLKLNYPIEQEARLIKAASTGDVATALSALEQFFSHVRRNNSDLFSAILCCITLRIELAHLLIDEGLTVEVALFSPIAWSPQPNLSEVEGALRESVRRVARQMSTQQSIPPTVLMAVRYIQQNYAKSDLSLGEVAQHVHITPGYLSSLFNASMNMSFTDYIHSVRIRCAQMLMRTTALRNYELSERVGYADPKYFAQIFRKFTGMSPSQYKYRQSEDGKQQSSISSTRGISLLQQSFASARQCTSVSDGDVSKDLQKAKGIGY